MKMAVTALVLALLTTGTMARDSQIVGVSFCDEKQVPPPEFDYEPHQAITIKKFPDHFLVIGCNVLWARPKSLGGCVFDWDETTATIYVRDDLTPGELACVLRHEKAHVNGWEHTLDYFFSTVPQGPQRKLVLYTPVP